MFLKKQLKIIIKEYYKYINKNISDEEIEKVISSIFNKLSQ